jgi:hypothetical protein
MMVFLSIIFITMSSMYGTIEACDHEASVWGLTMSIIFWVESLFVIMKQKIIPDPQTINGYGDGDKLKRGVKTYIIVTALHYIVSTCAYFYMFMWG